MRKIIFNKRTKNRQKNEKKDFLKGGIKIQDKLSPTYINLNNPRYLEIDGLYYGGLIVVNYYREQEDLILKINHKSNFNLEYITNKDEVYILKLINLVEKTLQKIKYNVNLELLLDSFYIELRRLDE